MKKLLFICLFIHSCYAAHWYVIPHGGVGFLNTMTEHIQPFKDTGVLKYKAQFHTGMTLGGSFGYRKDFWDISLLYSYGYNSLEIAKSPRIQDNTKSPPQEESINALEGYIQSHTLILQGLFFISTRSPFLPYIALGPGYLRIKSKQRLGFTFFDKALVDDSANAFGYRVKSGFQYQVTKTFLTDFYYAFLGAVRPKFKDTSGHSFHSTYYLQSINFSFVYLF